MTKHQAMKVGNDLVGESRVPALEIKFEKLLGFNTIREQLGNGVDFQDPTLAAKLGAKVGELDK